MRSPSALGRAAALLAGAGLLVSCRHSASLDAKEVLRRASEASLQMQSVQFDLQGHATNADASSTILSAKGWTQNAGHQVQLSLSVKGYAKDVSTPRFSFAGDIIVAGEREIYLHPTDLRLPVLPGDGAINAQLLNHWFALPSSGSGTAPGITPDPALLRLQTEAVTVTAAHGVVSLQGTSVYQYDVTIDQEKLLAFLKQVSLERHETFDAETWKQVFNSTQMQGTVWIGTDDFLVRKIAWHLLSQDAKKPWDLQFEISLSDFNGAPLISPPKDSIPLGSFLSGNLLPLLNTPVSLPHP